MAEFVIIREEYHRGFDAEGNSVVGPFYTFTVDGVPSLFWQPECNVPRLPKTYYIDRTINRLKAGRSADAFGKAPTVSVGGRQVRAEPGDESKLAEVERALRAAGLPPAKVEQVLRQARQAKAGRGRVTPDEGPVATETVPVHGGGAKPREKRRGYRYHLDGQCCEQTYPTEAAARAACAIQAFMTRGKLGRIAEAQATLEAQFPGQECKVVVCPKEHGVVARVGGKKYSVGFGEDGVRFKALEA